MLLDRAAEWYWEQDSQFFFTKFEAKEDLAKSKNLVQTGSSWADLKSADLGSGQWSDHLESLDAHEPFFNLELRLRDENGVAQWLSLCAVPVTDATGAFQGYRGIGKNIALFNGTDISLEDVMNRAESALKQAKQDFLHSVRFFDPIVEARAIERRKTQRELSQALEYEQLLLYYQPIVNSKRDVVGYEALVRWKHPVQGIVPPSKFIDIAEQSGLIVPIGAWVIAKACRQLSIFAAQSALKDLTIAVNLSGRQLEHPSLVDSVKKILANTGAPASNLKFEITETIMLTDIDKTVDKLHQLSRLGIRFSLDDFGIGYSSLNYLKKLPLSVLKIDQSFVRELLIDPVDAAIVKTILQLAISLGLSVIAEGVELEGQRTILANMGCREFQGYLFGKPAPLS